jgi:16S rRNA (guanine966-N2)-methyltransferase
VRIIAGRWRGRRLAEVGRGDAKHHLRPTTDRTRESLFGVLEGGRYGDPVDGARVLDLFAGTGALGLEALSRGAVHATFVESHRAALGLLEANIRSLDAPARILRADATRLPPGEPHDLVFLDPPYGQGMGERALTSARAQGWIAPGALVVWEEAAPQEAPEGFDKLEDRRYGDTWITFFHVAEGSVDE